MAGPSAINPLKYIIDRQYSEDLFIKNKLFKERLAKAKNLYRKDLVSHYGCVNAIEFSQNGEYLVSGGDDRRVLLWKIPEAVYEGNCISCSRNIPEGLAPIIMKKTHNSNIFCVAFSSKHTRIFSGGNDDQVIIHEAYYEHPLSIIPHRKPVYGLSVNPQKDEIIATAGEDGRLLLYDIRDTLQHEAQVLAKQKTGFHSVMFNPVNPRFLVSANSEEGIALWDCRKPKEELVRYDPSIGKISGISACFNSTGKKVLALRRRLPPVLYNTQSEQSICQFYHPQYYNSCTMKTCSFAGENDEYVLSGSDDFNLYMWKMPEDEDEWGACHMVLKGHRSIVNQVRYNRHNNLIASSGVEKMVKLWSTISMGPWTGSLLKEYSEPSRIIYTHQDYAELVGSSGERISHDYSDQSTYEDSKMMAFFDALIQREIEGWASSEETQTSDSDSDGDQDYSKLLQGILRSRNKTFEEPRKHKHNRIAQLICKKRNTLARMAYNKAYSSVQRKQLREKRKRKARIAQKQKSANKKLKLSSYFETKKNNYLSESSARSLRYRTRQCLREARENAVLDMPSTSTGITSSNSLVYTMFNQDSDDEALNLSLNEPENVSSNNDEEEEEVNLVNILPTPLNGTQEHIINNLEIMSNVDIPISNGSSSSNETATNDYNNGASTSAGSSGSYKTPYPNDSEEDSPSTSPENGYSTSTSEFECATPPKKRRNLSQSDSGCGTGPSSTKSRRFMEKYVCFNARKTPETVPGTSQNGHTSDEENRNERFRKKIRKVRLNLRNRVCSNDSDSN
ncbi:unnamed protein product [Ceutorhynchus assimilis]|uniref:DDB1- and CUL4-associated factor 5 n=1 Tax=Ceutorhynchus assimilis TaxID=467358 RepID=A0A9N9MFJ9_9CUCU|nr:unnamed protein product [Ceutorhynchus assimilis]